MITEKSFRTGGKHNGRLLLNSHQRVQFSITMYIIQGIKKVELNHVNSNNGQTLLSRLISILQEAM